MDLVCTFSSVTFAAVDVIVAACVSGTVATCVTDATSVTAAVATCVTAATNVTAAVAACVIGVVAAVLQVL